MIAGWAQRGMDQNQQAVLSSNAWIIGDKGRNGQVGPEKADKPRGNMTAKGRIAKIGRRSAVNRLHQTEHADLLNPLEKGTGDMASASKLRTSPQTRTVMMARTTDPRCQHKLHTGTAPW